ncbi:MAG: prolipoprotein diacylglyceryl transferase [Clostridia bacterium]|nr:prolipoprotein diacylglyceryl transferase [Clostridia bacterium]
MGNFISKLSFPGLGIPEFEIDRVAFEINIGKLHLSVAWYGLIICVGIMLAFFYVVFRAGQHGIVLDTILDYALVTVPLAIFGARIYYVIFNPEGYDSFYDIIAIWNGGLAIYGAIIVGAICVLCVSIYKKIKFMLIADFAAPAVMLGQAIGRWGNFANGEAFGAQTTLPWRMGVNNLLTNFETIYVHPTFLYESLWNLLGFALINIFYKKKKFHGEIMLWYVTWYGLGRAFIETLRTDSLYLGNTDIRVSSLLGALCFVLLLPLIIIGRVRFAQMSKAGTIAADKPADLAVLLGIVKPEAAKLAEEEPTDEDDILEITEAPSVTELLEDNIESTENAEDGEKEE